MKLFGDVFQAGTGNPIPNSYWVEPGRLLAGEYPGATRSEPSGRVRVLLDAGITSFVDLTGEGELTPYQAQLPPTVLYRRFPIVDHSLPNSPATMDGVVAAIETDLAAGRRVYVHCRAGIGRTGMAVGCYLIQRGVDGTAALAKLQELWQRCARSRSWPSIPETEEQVRYVREWLRPGARTTLDVAKRAEGALLGLAVGEALAQFARDRHLAETVALTESKRAERLPTGADTGMTIAAADSLLTHGRHDASDQLARYVAWGQQPGAQLRMPAELKRVLATWQWSRKRNAVSHDPKNLDAHPLARSLAAALFARGDAFKAAELAADLAGATLQAPLILDSSRVWAATLVSALSGAPKQELTSMRAASTVMHGRPVKPSIAALLSGQWSRIVAAEGAVFAVARALDAVRTASSFELAVSDAMRISTSAAALAGSLAGAHFGPHAIAAEWRAGVPESAALSALARRFGA